jgi:hypothetical protein
MALAAYARNLYAPTKFVDVNIVVIQATFTSGVPVRDADNSSPETTITGDDGEYAITFPKGTGVHLLGAYVALAEAAGIGQSVHWEGLSASLGTGSFELTSETVNTPVAPTDDSRIYLTFLVFNQ